MKKIILIALPIILIAFGAWFFSDSQVIKRRTNAIIDTLELPEGTSRVNRAGKSQQLRDLLDDNITITYPAGNNLFNAPVNLSIPITLPNDSAVNAHLYLTESIDYMKVGNLKIHSPNITDNKATISIAFSLTAKQKKGAEKSTDLKGTFEFTKTKKGWRLSQATFESN